MHNQPKEDVLMKDESIDYKESNILVSSEQVEEEKEPKTQKL